RAFVESLAHHHQVVRFDARGNGLSDWDVHRLELDDLVLDLEAVMDGLAFERAVLWGSSYGGPIAAVYAARHPERVDRIVFDGAFVEGSTIASREQQETFIQMLKAAPGAGYAAFSYLSDPEPAT